MEEPRPVSEIDNEAEKTFRLSRQFIYSVMIAQGVLLVIVAVVAGILGYRSFTERARTDAEVTQILSAQCGLFYSVASSPVTTATTRLGFNLVNDSRGIVRGDHCSQVLPPPSKTLVQLGQKYGAAIHY